MGAGGHSITSDLCDHIWWWAVFIWGSFFIIIVFTYYQGLYLKKKANEVTSHWSVQWSQLKSNVHRSNHKMQARIIITCWYYGNLRWYSHRDLMQPLLLQRLNLTPSHLGILPTSPIPTPPPPHLDQLRRCLLSLAMNGPSLLLIRSSCEWI